MDIMLVTIILLSFVVSATPKCQVRENLETKEFTYHICESIGYREFKNITQYCKTLSEKAEIVTFSSEKEFEFLIRQLQQLVREEFRFYPGIMQAQSDKDRYNPQTGRYYWVTNPKEKITKESETYWQPFSMYITNFANLTLEQKQAQYFLMDREGGSYPAVTFNAGGLNGRYDNPGIVCMEPGIKTQTTTERQSGEPEPRTGSLTLWLIIVVSLAAVVLLILVGVAVGCCISKRKAKFHKVPQHDKKERFEHTV